MKSTKLLLSASVVALFTTLALNGCSSDDTSNGTDDDAGSSSGNGGGSSSGNGGGSSSSGGSSSGGTAESCYVPAGGVGWSSSVQLAGSGNCTTEQIDALWTACGAAGNTPAGCEAAQTAAAACAACITGSGEPATRKSGIFGYDDEDGGLFPSTFVCEANAIGQAAECGTKVDNLNSCMIGACAPCYEIEDPDEAIAALDACEEQAYAGPCAVFIPTVECDALYETPENVTKVETACGDLSGETVAEADFKKASAYVCGTPPS